jgi:hypothetical protein
MGVHRIHSDCPENSEFLSAVALPRGMFYFSLILTRFYSRFAESFNDLRESLYYPALQGAKIHLKQNNESRRLASTLDFYSATGRQPEAMTGAPGTYL